MVVYKRKHAEGEKRGLVKLQIIEFLHNKDDWVDPTTVADYIRDWSRDRGKPIRQPSGIYKHLDDLATKKLIVRNDEGNYATVKDPDLNKISDKFERFKVNLTMRKEFRTFKEISEFIFINNLESDFINTNYFKYSLKKFFSRIVSDYINTKKLKNSIENNVKVNLQKRESIIEREISRINISNFYNAIKEMVALSPTAFRYLLKLDNINNMIVKKFKKEKEELKKKSIYNIHKPISMFIRRSFLNVTKSSQKINSIEKRLFDTIVKCFISDNIVKEIYSDIPIDFKGNIMTDSEKICKKLDLKVYYNFPNI